MEEFPGNPGLLFQIRRSALYAPCTNSTEKAQRKHRRINIRRRAFTGMIDVNICETDFYQNIYYSYLYGNKNRKSM